jgi:uncharacterized protein YegJ (DUF2314 family)
MPLFRDISVLTLVFAAFSVAACSRRDSPKSAASSSGPPVIDVEDDDPEMARAIREARETLPEFWSRLESPQEGDSDFSLKVKWEDETGTAYVWLSQIERTGDKIYGRLENESDAVKSTHAGERVLVNEVDISDWLYMRNGKIVGDRTTRLLLAKMAPEEVEAYQRRLAEP